MGIESRVASLERRAGAGLCPCRKPRLIEYGEEDADAPAETGPGACALCGARLPVVRIVAVRPGNTPE